MAMLEACSQPEQKAAADAAVTVLGYMWIDSKLARLSVNSQTDRGSVTTNNGQPTVIAATTATSATADAAARLKDRYHDTPSRILLNNHVSFVQRRAFCVRDETFDSFIGIPHQ